MKTISFAAVAERLSCSRSTVDRWAVQGFNVDGKIVRLPYIRQGRRRFTTERAVAEFLGRIQLDRFHGRHDPIAEEAEAEMRSALTRL
jgi:transposase